MTDRLSLRILSTAAMALAIALSLFAMLGHLTPSLPAYLTFLFVGLIGSFSERSARSLERRIAALESRG
jgi:hypothetical protein